MGEMIRIPIAKAGKGKFLEIDVDELNAVFSDPETGAALMLQAVTEGLKVILNSRMSKLAAPSKLEGKAAEENEAAALAKAKENLADFKAGKLAKKAAGAKAAGVDRATMTEATRLAKDVVKNEIRKAGMKISHVEPKVITAAAKSLVESDPSYVEQAKANLAERATIKPAVDISSIISESPALIAKAEKAKADKKSQLSAKQASKADKRVPGKVPSRRPEASASH